MQAQQHSKKTGTKMAIFVDGLRIMAMLTIAVIAVGAVLWILEILTNAWFTAFLLKVAQVMGILVISWSALVAVGTSWLALLIGILGLGGVLWALDILPLAGLQALSIKALSVAAVLVLAGMLLALLVRK